MRTSLTCLAMGMLLFTACGGGSSGGSTSTSTGTGTGTGTGVGTGTGTGVSTGTGTGVSTGTGTGVSTGTGTGVSTGTGTGSGTGTGTTITPQGNCAKLTCLNELANLANSCPLSGTCVTQTAGMGANICYSNGVKASVAIASLTAMSMTMTVKKGSSVCYSADITETTYVFKNGAGKVVANIGLETTAAGGTPVTCPDGTTGIVDSTCGSDVTDIGSDAPTSSSCTQGTCAF